MNKFKCYNVKSVNISTTLSWGSLFYKILRTKKTAVKKCLYCVKKCQKAAFMFWVMFWDTFVHLKSVKRNSPCGNPRLSDKTDCFVILAVCIMYNLTFILLTDNLYRKGGCHHRPHWSPQKLLLFLCYCPFTTRVLKFWGKLQIH